jgi:hypothetical protein
MGLVGGCRDVLAGVVATTGGIALLHQMDRRQKPLVMVASVLVFLVGSWVGQAHAQYSSDELKCRSTIAKNGAKLANTAAKTIAACHKARNKGTRNATDDCNDIEIADDKDKVAKAETKLADLVGGVKDKCAGLIPSSMGYEICPAPCQSIGMLGSFSQVAQCVTCIAETRVETAAADTLGMPAEPLPGTAEEKCHAALGKNVSKQLAALLRERTKCQNDAEKDGATNLTGCESGGSVEVDAAIAEARAKADSAIQDACAAVLPNFAALDSCETGSDVTLLADCVLDATEAAGEPVFVALYELLQVGAMTWTQIQTMLSGTCAGLACHTNGDALGGLADLDDYDLGYDELVNAAAECSGTSFGVRVLPGDADASFLMEKLDQTTPDCGSRMPLGGTPLGASIRDGIRQWILGGAPKN